MKETQFVGENMRQFLTQKKWNEVFYCSKRRFYVIANYEVEGDRSEHFFCNKSRNCHNIRESGKLFKLKRNTLRSNRSHLNTKNWLTFKKLFSLLNKFSSVIPILFTNGRKLSLECLYSIKYYGKIMWKCV